MTYLLSGLGTLVCRVRHSGALVHRPLTAPLGDADGLDIGDPTPSLQVGLGHFLRDDTETLDRPLADVRSRVGPSPGPRIAAALP